MKTAIVYYSMDGNTHETAEKLAARLGADLVRLTPKKAYPDKGAKKYLWGGRSAVMGDKPALEPYAFDADCERVIFGTPVWASSFTPPLRTFIRENREALRGKRFAAFACFKGGGGEKALAKLCKELGAPALDAELLLVDPRTSPDPENEKKLDAFCAALGE